MGWPCISFGSHGAAGAGRISATSVSSRGACSERARYISSTAGASLARHATTPPTISGPTS